MKRFFVLLSLMLVFALPTLAQDDATRQAIIDVVTSDPTVAEALSQYNQDDITIYFEPAEEGENIWNLEFVLETGDDEEFLGWILFDANTNTILEMEGARQELQISAEQRAAVIELVTSQPQFAEQLAAYPNYEVEIYGESDEDELFLEVEFFIDQGDDNVWLGWALVDANSRSVVDFFLPLILSEEEMAEQSPAIVAFAQNDPEVLALIGNPAEWQTYPNYNLYEMVWEVAFVRGLEIYIVWVFSEPEAEEFPLSIVNIYREDEMTEQQAENNRRDTAITIAYEYPSLDDVIAVTDDWQAFVQPQSENVYIVEFVSGDTRLACLVVDVAAEAVQSTC